jgi:hypothetical protein
MELSKNEYREILQRHIERKPLNYPHKTIELSCSMDLPKETKTLPPIPTTFKNGLWVNEALTSLKGIIKVYEPLIITKNHALTEITRKVKIGGGLQINECSNLKKIETVNNTDVTYIDDCPKLTEITSLSRFYKLYATNIPISKFGGKIHSEGLFNNCPELTTFTPEFKTRGLIELRNCPKVTDLNFQVFYLTLQNCPKVTLGKNFECRKSLNIPNNEPYLINICVQNFQKFGKKAQRDLLALASIHVLAKHFPWNNPGCLEIQTDNNQLKQAFEIHIKLKKNAENLNLQLKTLTNAKLKLKHL